MTEDSALEAAHAHCRSLQEALDGFRRSGLPRIADWGGRLAAVLTDGGRLLAAGNGGSAAQAQHLTAELVGRYRRERRAYSALALHAETSSVTAIGNDYGFDHVYARQVTAHGRPGDVLMLLSTSGRSANLIAAAVTARRAGLRVWALTGPLVQAPTLLKHGTLVGTVPVRRPPPPAPDVKEGAPAPPPAPPQPGLDQGQPGLVVDELDAEDFAPVTIPELEKAREEAEKQAAERLERLGPPRLQGPLLGPPLPPVPTRYYVVLGRNGGRRGATSRPLAVALTAAPPAPGQPTGVAAETMSLPGPSCCSGAVSTMSPSRSQCSRSSRTSASLSISVLTRMANCR